MPRTGPRSPEAKAVVSRNAVRHGLRAAAVVIPGMEFQQDWEQFHEDALQALDPVGAVEYALADRAATLLWRLRRAARAERDAAISGVRLVDGAVDDPRRNAGELLAGIRQELFPEEPPPSLPSPPREPPALLPHPDVLLKLSRYEARLSRQLVHVLHEIEALQDRRLGRDAPLARVDVSGLPEGDD